MLFGAVSIGHAQVEIKSVADLQTAKDSVAKIATYQSDLQNAKNSYNTLLAMVSSTSPTDTKETTAYFPKGQLEKDAMRNYYNNVMAYATKLQEYDKNVKLRIKSVTSSAGLFGETTTLYIYSPNQDVSNIQGVRELSVEEKWTKESTVISDGNEITSIVYYILKRDGTFEENTYTVSSGSVYDLAVLGQINNCGGSVIIDNQPYTIETTQKNDAYLRAKKAVADNLTLQSYYNAAINGGQWDVYNVAWNEDETDVDMTITKSTETFALGCVKYKNLKLIENINITDENFTMYDIEKGYKFDGNNKTITLAGQTLFETNNGTISNLTFTGGNLTETNSGTITGVTATNGANVAYSNTGKINNATLSGGGYVVNTNRGDITNAQVTDGTIANVNNGTITKSFGTSGTKTTVYGTQGNTATVDATNLSTYYNIYNDKTLRDEFGVDVTTGNVSTGSSYKLYEVKMYHSGNKTGETRIANIDATGKPVIKRTWTKQNAGEFYYISDSDAGNLFDGITGDNVAKNVVYTHDGNNWECKVAVVSNGSNSIYIPRAFTAANVEYNRTFNVAAKNAATVCLPFDVSEETLDNALGKDGHLLQFNKIDGQTYWFKYVTDGMKANQPYILLFGKDVNTTVFNGLQDVVFSATGESQDLKALAQSTEASGASLYGTFEKRTASELEDGAKYSIYGFQNGKFVRMTDNVNFNATRAYVRAPWTDPTASSGAKSYALGILDENDNVVTGISTVEDAADKFSVNGGNGMININADKAQLVKVYTVGGALVKSADVKAGATSLPVPAGMYIVNGNKVVVK